MLFRALPQNSQIDRGFEANGVFAPKVRLIFKLGLDSFAAPIKSQSESGITSNKTDVTEARPRCAFVPPI